MQNCQRRNARRAIVFASAAIVVITASAAFGTTYLSYAHCKQDLDAAWEAVRRVPSITPEMGLNEMQRISKYKDKLRERAYAIGRVCAQMLEAENQQRERAELARREEQREKQAAEQARLEQQRSAEDQRRRAITDDAARRFPDNHVLRQQEVQRQQAASAAQRRREGLAREQERRDAETRSELYGTVGRMLQSGLSGSRQEAPVEDDRYNKAHDVADKVAEKIRPDNKIVNKYQDAASDEVRYRSQRSLETADNVGKKISSFGNESTAKVSNPWSAPVGRPDPAVTNPWASSSGTTTGVQNPWGLTGRTEVALAKPSEDPRRTEQTGPSEASPVPSNSRPTTEPAAVGTPGIASPPQGYVYYRDRPGGPLRLVQLSTLTDRSGDDPDKGQSGCSRSGVGIVITICEMTRGDTSRSQPVSNPGGGGAR